MLGRPLPEREAWKERERKAERAKSRQQWKGPCNCRGPQQFEEGISFLHSCVFVSKASPEALCHYHQQGQEQETMKQRQRLPEKSSERDKPGAESHRKNRSVCYPSEALGPAGPATISRKEAGTRERMPCQVGAVSGGGEWQIGRSKPRIFSYALKSALMCTVLG